ncbi:MAG TPA: hypothetical protein VGR78_10495 [Verrucomicrobiae bacterium]|jgi:hypothetical protein|nr:hypothetical protein [Verrucomicrobiae bacterium]
MTTQTQLTKLCFRVRAFIERNEGDFDQLALDLFTFQFASNAPYQRFCNSRGKTPATVRRTEEIPALPTSAFKEFAITVLAPSERTAAFHSSGTTQHRPSRHFHNRETLRLYEAGLCAWFKPFVLPDAEHANFLVLTPRGSATPNSSLVHMFETVTKEFGGESSFAAHVSDDGSWELDFAAIEAACITFDGRTLPMIVCGTAFSFVHLHDHLVNQDTRLVLPKGSRVFETGGYKGRSRSVPKEELHGMIEDRLQILRSNIITEYGMSELSSQAYDHPFVRSAALTKGHEGSPSKKGDTGCDELPSPCSSPLDGRGDVAFSWRTGPSRIFRFPPWVRTMIICPETGDEVQDGAAGLVRVVDLANVGSVLAVQTEDLAIRRGLGFELIGRAPLSEPRGCSLMPVSS